MVGYELITVDMVDEVRVVTMNRPDKLNAWTPVMAEELADAIHAGNNDPAIGSIVLTGAGRGFCAGADMDATFATRIAGVDPGDNTAEGQGGMPAGLDWVALCRASKPLVAAVNGAAIGIGVTQILPFDYVIAATKAKLGMGFITVGLVPELASTHFLVQRMGWGRANELALSGRVLLADEALQSGLVDRVVEPDELLDTAIKVAASMGRQPAPQLRMTKQLLTENGSDTDLVAVQARESALLRECWASPEHAEAVQAFLEKRRPAFPPRA